MMNMLVGVLVEVIKTVSEIEREQRLGRRGDGVQASHRNVADHITWLVLGSGNEGLVDD